MDQSTNEEGPQRSGSVKRAREKAAAEDRKRREQYEREYEDQPPPLHVRRREERQRELEMQQRRQQPQRVQQQMGYGPRTNMIQPQPQQQPQQEPQQQQQGGQMWPLPVPSQMDRVQQQQRQPLQHNASGRPVMGQQRVHPSLRQAPHVQEHSAQVVNEPEHELQSREAESFLDETSISSSVLTAPGSGTDLSRESQASSAGTIPDFPASVPAKPTGLGPPPSARRGPESFYSVNSAVTPIVEESPRVPAFDPTTSYLADKTPEEYGGREQSPTFFDGGMSDEDDFHIEQPIVRSASMGRKGRPTMVSHQNRNSDKTQEGGVLSKTRALMGAGMINAAGSKPATKSQFEKAVQQKDVPPLMPTVPTIVHPVYREKEAAPWHSRRGDGPRWPSFGGDESPIENKDLDLMSSDSESTLTQQTPTPGEHALKKLAPAAVLANARSHLTPSPSHSNKLDEEKDSNAAIPEIQYNRNSAIRRPPKLNLNAVRDAEARGSLTSLPDLIRRATKLASMMNEGKRPASRFNDLNSFPMEGSEKGSLAPDNRASGLSGMLAAFPPPGANGTPLATPRSGSHWPGYASSTKGLRTPHAESRPKVRRCCGMPLWCFVLSLVVLLCVIAAAVIIPLKLVVFKDKEVKGEERAKGVTAIEICQRDAECLNGGTSVISGSGCSCICANGYEGPRCDSLGTQGCTTVDYFGTETGERFEKITVGNAIPRLVDESDAKYSIRLFWEDLVNQFGKGEISCSLGNSLVSFHGGTGAEGEASSSTTKAAPSSKASTTAAPTVSSTGGNGNGGLGKRQVGVDTDIALATGTATAALSKPSGSVASVITAPSATVTGTSQTPSAKSEDITISSDTLDFARVAVLYVVQERSVSEGLQAQDGLINCLKGAEDVTATNNSTIRADQGMFAWTNANGGTGFVDLASWTVGLGGEGGKKVGGRGSGGKRTF